MFLRKVCGGFGFRAHFAGDGPEFYGNAPRGWQGIEVHVCIYGLWCL